MHKKIVQFAELHNLTCDNRSMYGTYNGYPITVDFGGTTSSIGLVSILVNPSEKLNDFIAFIESKKNDLKITQTQISPCGLHCSFLNMTANSSLKKAENILNACTEKLKELEIAGNLCPYCNQPLEDSILVADGLSKFHAHEACFDEKLSKTEQLETTETEKPNNYLRGVLGALAGALIGGATFAILFFVGFLAVLSSFVGAICASLLYTKLGGKNNKVKIISVIATTLVVTVVAFLLCNVIDVAILLKEYNVDYNPFTMLFDLIANDSNVAQAFWKDVILTLVFYIAGIVVVVRNMITQQTKPSTLMKKL